MKPNFKDLLKVTITESRNAVKNLTDKQLTAMYTKLEKLYAIVESELEFRESAIVTEELMQEAEEEAIAAAEEAANEIDDDVLNF